MTAAAALCNATTAFWLRKCHRTAHKGVHFTAAAITRSQIQENGDRPDTGSRDR